MSSRDKNIMNPNKTYGGKSGVWLIKKRKLSSTSKTAKANLSSIGPAANDFTKPSTSSSMEKVENDHLNFKFKLYSSRADAIIKRPRTEVFLRKASRHIGCIPKKYLIQQRKRAYQYSTYSNSNKRQRQNECSRDAVEGTTNHNDHNHARYSHGSSDSSEVSSFVMTSPQDNAYLPNQIRLLNQTITQSPNVRLLGWDSMKCRPIYNSTQPNSDVIEQPQQSTDYNLLDPFRLNPNSNGDYGNDDRDDIEYSDDEDNNNNNENEDPNEMWKNILSQMNQNSRRTNASHNRPKTYGGTNARTSDAKSKSRKGLSEMPQSVLERLVSPKHNRKEEVKNLVCKKPSSKRITKKNRRNSLCSPKIGIVGRLSHKGKPKSTCSKRSKSKSARKSLNFTNQRGILKSPMSHSATFTSNTNTASKIIMTPKTKPKSKSYICLEPSSDVSKDVSLSSVLCVPTSSSSLSSSSKKQQPLSSRRMVINSLSSPPSTLNFPENLDYDEKENAVTSLPSKRSSFSSTATNSNRTTTTKDTNERRPTTTKSNNRKVVKAKKKDSNNDKHHKNHNDAKQVNQITSSTSLAAAKAFFERLDQYELTIA